MGYDRGVPLDDLNVGSVYKIMMLVEGEWWPVVCRFGGFVSRRGEVLRLWLAGDGVGERILVPADQIRRIERVPLPGPPG